MCLNSSLAIHYITFNNPTIHGEAQFLICKMGTNMKIEITYIVLRTTPGTQ